MVSGLSSAVTVPEGFVVDPLIDIDDWPSGHAWPIRRLEAIRNPDYGVGVISASVDNSLAGNGILEVMRISKSTVEIINTIDDFSTPSDVGDIRFDTTGLFGNDSNDLFVTVWTDTEAEQSDWMQSFSTCLMRVPSDSNDIDEVAYYQGEYDNRLLFMLDFISDANGYEDGCYLADYAIQGGTSFYRLDPYNLETLDDLTGGVLPIDSGDPDPNRTDMDPRGMEFDRTGNYNSYLTIADTELNEDDKSAIYQLEPNLPDPNLPATDFIWSTIAGPNSISGLNGISFRDMCYGAGNGSFGGALYVTESISDSVMIVETNGRYTEFASGFNGIQSITIDESGGYMYVSDIDAVYKIWMTGPTIVMQEPKTVNDGVFTDTDGVASLRLLWSEPILFSDDDVYVEDQWQQEVDVSLSFDSDTQIMTIEFARSLQYDKFTITIADTVICEETGCKIDGDGDGLSGGDAVIVMEHRLREDLDGDNYIDMIDLAMLAEKWLWTD